MKTLPRRECELLFTSDEWITARGMSMSQKSIGILVGLYFLAALAFALFRAFSNPFFARLDGSTFGEAIGAALLLFFGTGLLPLLRWALDRFRPQYAWRTLALYQSSN